MTKQKLILSRIKMISAGSGKEVAVPYHYRLRCVDEKGNTTWKRDFDYDLVDGHYVLIEKTHHCFEDSTYEDVIGVASKKNARKIVSKRLYKAAKEAARTYAEERGLNLDEILEEKIK